MSNVHNQAVVIDPVIIDNARLRWQDVVAVARHGVNVGKGLEAGLAIVILAVVIDRITQAYGRPRHEVSK